MSFQVRFKDVNPRSVQLINPIFQYDISGWVIKPWDEYLTFNADEKISIIF